MVQNSFSLLFLLVLGAGAFSLLRSVRESWTQIAAVLVPSAEPAVPLVYSTTRVAAADVPWVAQRLVLRELEEALPPAVTFAAWAPRPPAPRADRQMAFAFPERLTG